MKRFRYSVATALGALVLVGVLVTTASAAPSSSTTVFNSIPKTLPGNVSSVGFEATSTSEFGDYARFAGNKRHLVKVSVVMSSWGCESGTWHTGDCLTTPGATFSTDITLKLYANPGNGALGTLIPSGARTQTFAIPYRPSAAPACGDGRWQATNGTCYNGFATIITFNFSSANVTLPASVIYAIAYDTTHYGYVPIGETAACFTTSGGCGYDSLNVSAASTTPKLGIDDDVNGVFLNSSWTGAYCSGASGAFRLDSPCWTGFNPMVRFTARR